MAFGWILTFRTTSIIRFFFLYFLKASLNGFQLALVIPSVTVPHRPGQCGSNQHRKEQCRQSKSAAHAIRLPEITPG